jgi:hypothetical protein
MLCGAPAQAKDQDHWNYGQCGANPKTCMLPGVVGSPMVVVPAFATFIQGPVTSAWILQSVWCPANSIPVPNTAALRDQAIRLLPRIPIGAAPPAQTLVNIQTIFWAATTANRDLGPVVVTGTKVWLHIEFRQATWNFGDGAMDTANNPGKKYTTDDACTTKLCPDYYGHVYTTTGTRTATLTIAWNAEFSIDNQHWTTIGTDTISGPNTTLTLTVRQARAQLIANPTPH